MKYIILVLVLLCSLYPLYGQASNTDSTDIKLNNLLTKIESPGAVDSFIMTCVIEFDRKGNFDRSIEYVNKLRVIAEAKNNILIMAQCFLKIGLANTRISKYKEAFENYNKAIAYTENVKNDTNFIKIYADVLNNAGSAFDDIGNYEKAVDYYTKSAKAAESLSDTIRLFKATSNTGASLYILGKYDKALEYYNKSYSLAKHLKIKHFTSQSLYNIGTVYYSKEQYPKALEYYNQVIFAFQELKDKESIGRIMVWGGQLYFALKNFDKALELYNQGIAISYDINDELGVAIGNFRLAEYFNKTKDYKKSIKYSKASLQYFEKNGIPSWNMENYNILSDTYSHLKDYKNGYDYIYKQLMIKDSLSKKDISSLVTNFEINQELEKNNRRIELMQKDNQIQLVQKNNLIYLILTIFLGLLIISILLYSRYRLKSKLHQQVAELNATKDKFFTIISHDLKTPIAGFNNLSTVVADYYADLSEEDKIKHMKSLKHSSTHILTLLNNLLTWARLQTEKITAHPDTIHLHTIVDKEIQSQKQSADKKSISIESFIPSEIYGYADADMISTVIRNLLSNAVKFTPENGKIVLSATESQEFIKFDVTDTGIGIPKEVIPNLFEFDKKHSTLGTANERGTGLGLNLCKEFIILNHGTISVVSEVGKGSTFTFTVPRIDQ